MGHGTDTMPHFLFPTRDNPRGVSPGTANRLERAKPLPRGCKAPRGTARTCPGTPLHSRLKAVASRIETVNVPDLHIGDVSHHDDLKVHFFRQDLQKLSHIGTVLG